MKKRWRCVSRSSRSPDYCISPPSGSEDPASPPCQSPGKMKKRLRFVSRSRRSPGYCSSPPSESGDPASTPCQSAVKMKKRLRFDSRSRRSPGCCSSPPSGSGDPASPPCQPTSPGTCGGGGMLSAPALALAGDKCRTKPKQRRKAAKRQISLIIDESPVPGSIRITPPSNCPNLHGEVSSAPTPGKKAGKRVVHKTGKAKSFSSRRLVYSKSVASLAKSWFDEEETSSGLKVEKPKSSSGYHDKISVDEYVYGQSDRTPSLSNECEDGPYDKTPTPSVNLSKIAQDEEVSCDGGEASSLIMVEKKPKPSSGDHVRIAQEDEDLIAQDEDGQHSKKIGLHGIEVHKQEEERPSGHPQDLLYVDDETISKKMSYFSKMLNDDSPELHYYPEYEPEELIELYERLAFYRIRAYELTVDRKLAALDDANLKLQYPSSKLYDEGFFEYYEESLEWYFDPELCKNARFDDYQRITLRSCGKYQDWERYHSTLNTYEEDLAYVQFCEVLANETKWIEDYMGDSTHRWSRIEDVVYIQALEIAAGFPNVSPFLISYSFKEHIRSMEFDHDYKGLDGLYFEIWKRVAKGKMSFREALLEAHSKDMFPSLSWSIKLELEHTEWGHQMKDFYDAYVAGIDEMASDDEALGLITEAVAEMFPRDRYYLDYAKKKLCIAKDIGLISKARRREVALNDNGQNGKERVSLEKGIQALTGCEKGSVSLLA